MIIHMYKTHWEMLNINFSVISPNAQAKKW